MAFRVYTTQDFKVLKRITTERWGKYIDYSEPALSRVLKKMYEDESFSHGTIFEFRYAQNRLRETRELSGETSGNLDLFSTVCASRSIWTSQQIGSELERIGRNLSTDYEKVYLTNLASQTNQDFMIWYLTKGVKGDDDPAKERIIEALERYASEKKSPNISQLSWKELSDFAKSHKL